MIFKLKTAKYQRILDHLDLTRRLRPPIRPLNQDIVGKSIVSILRKNPFVPIPGVNHT